MLGLLTSLALARIAIATASCNTSSEAHQSKFIAGSNGIEILTANGTSSVVVLDYGHEVEGIPSFEVLSHVGDTSIFEVSYAESLAAFDMYMVNRCAAERYTQFIHADFLW